MYGIYMKACSAALICRHYSRHKLRNQCRVEVVAGCRQLDGGRRLQCGHSLTSRPWCFQLLVDGSVNSVVLDGLTPLTQYLVHVYSVVREISSEPLTGTETTRKCSSSSQHIHSRRAPFPPPRRRSSLGLFQADGILGKCEINRGSGLLLLSHVHVRESVTESFNSVTCD